MYSKNDYRYYLEHRMREENYLAHYGVKGMKWNKRKAVKTLGDTAQFVSDKGFLGYLDGEKRYKENAKKNAQALRMDRVGSVAKDSARKAKKLKRKKPQIEAASKYLVAETANAAATGLHGAIRKKKIKSR